MAPHPPESVFHKKEPPSPSASSHSLIFFSMLSLTPSGDRVVMSEYRLDAISLKNIGLNCFIKKKSVFASLSQDGWYDCEPLDGPSEGMHFSLKSPGFKYQLDLC